LHTSFAGALVIFDVLHSVFVGNGITSPFKWGVSDIADIDEEKLHFKRLSVPVKTSISFTNITQGYSQSVYLILATSYKIQKIQFFA
jgi:hypothetical protein